ncbi:MAG: hypothetical protein ACRC6M_13425 [Microcystaceae cyanobacterium]
MKNKLQSNFVMALLLGTSLTVPQTAQAITFTIDFDDFTSVPLNDSTGFEFANGGSTYQGVTFGSPNQFNVTGKDYRVDPTPGPLFAIPKSDNYYINNRETVASFLTTSYILTEAWFGSVEYYGFGGSATSVSVTALGASGDLDTVSIVLPDVIGQPDPMVQMDTSRFLNLSGITGYRIERSPTPDQVNAFQWAGDNFTFTDAVPAAVPWETDTLPLLGSTVLLGGGLWLKNKFSKTRQK